LNNDRPELRESSVTAKPLSDNTVKPFDFTFAENKNEINYGKPAKLDLALNEIIPDVDVPEVAKVKTPAQEMVTEPRTAFKPADLSHPIKTENLYI